MDPLLHMSIAIFLAILLGTSALHKLQNIHDFRQALSGYGFPVSVTRSFAVYMVPATEILISVLLLTGSFMGAWAGLALFSAYFLLLSVGLASGKAGMDCGCSWGGRPGLLSRLVLVRNGVLIILSLALLLPATDRLTGWLDYSNAAFAGLAFFMIYIAADTAIALRSQHFWNEGRAL